jgi:hypothetical protein
MKAVSTAALWWSFEKIRCETTAAKRARSCVERLPDISETHFFWNFQPGGDRSIARTAEIDPSPERIEFQSRQH